MGRVTGTGGWRGHHCEEGSREWGVIAVPALTVRGGPEQRGEQRQEPCGRRRGADRKSVM